MSIKPIVEIGCDICPASVTVPVISGQEPPLPDGWYDTGNDDCMSYCLAEVQIICGTCHDKLRKCVESIRAESSPHTWGSDITPVLCSADERGTPHETIELASGRKAYRFVGKKEWRYVDDDSAVPREEFMSDDVERGAPSDASEKHTITAVVMGKRAYHDGDDWIYEDDGSHVPLFATANLPTAPAAPSLDSPNLVYECQGLPVYHDTADNTWRYYATCEEVDLNEHTIISRERVAK